MKKKLLHGLNELIKWLQVKQEILSKGDQAQITAYNSLSPIASADKDNHYTQALNWAFKTRRENEIRNIALTGPYGSGKSSILKTFRESYRDKDLHFLSISLATFKEDQSQSSTPGEELLRLIELSILQQIFYHEEDHKIPDSRFRKIKSFKKRHLLGNTIGVFLFFIALAVVSYPEIFKKTLRYEFGPVEEPFIHYLSLIFIILGISIIIFRSIRLLNSIRLSKLNIQNAEFAINENVNKSILNHHIDEILYFFEVRPYNVVIIEDLDRFEQTEIFTKLREINLLVNNSKKIKKDVVFIYAVRDDMFKDKERTKFFDFIIPVIPVINASNSSEILIEKKVQNNYNLSDDLIENISLFIDDMRLLHNIVNEFYIYHQKLNKTLNQDKLLSILVYKNIFPNDFSLLSNNEGILFQAINHKRKYLSAEITKIEDEISKIKDEIMNLESLKLKDIKELRALYIFKYVQKLELFKSFTINNVDYDVEAVLEDDLFEYIVNNKAKYTFFQNYNNVYYNQNSARISAEFKEVEKEVDPLKGYFERENLILNFSKGKIDALKKKIQV